MKSSYKRIGDYIELVDERNKELNVDLLLGLSISKQFIPSVANTVGADMSNYKIIKKGQFACSIMQVRRDGKMPIALLQDFDEAIISQAYPVFRVIDENKLLPEYLMMWFSRSEFDRQATFHAVGGVRGSLEWDDFLDFELPIPSIEKQQKIVNEYNTITKRIALNEQLNQKLEETAQTLYKHWFVDFEFPNEEGKPYKSSGGKMVYNEELDKEIPEGWEDAKLSELLEVKYGKDYKHLKSGDIPLYGSGGIMGYYDKALYEKPSILIPRKGSLDNILFVDEPFWSVDTMFYTIINNESYTNYLFHFLKKIDYYSLNVGLAVPSMTTKVLNDITILLPSSNTLGNFEALTSKMLRIVKQNDRQQFSLIELASTILSKMSKEETKTVVV
ncbi:hypothetical protein pgond44_07165 [Psychroflexus gondwanensis ACAM 44]|uniref:Type I restriction modification DNA specificity domain-containing protein n=1 Tax=Psychroflexus gondwanensis ACAM 44 TaxID=1189619 RepID=N1WWP6_9FLAO|nr:restriction endonuclease subunit S [Psychroflexus gondwanensis]EMY81612.1 hypothetical protein pgond44_07165 [Psychroflexus gondwanensis ACAM 44]